MARLAPQHDRAVWRSPDDRFGLAFEISAVAALGILPYLFAAIAPQSQAADESGTTQDEVWRAMYIVQICLPLLFIMWRSGRSWRSFGIVRPKWRIDLPLTVVYLMVAAAGYFAFAILFMGAQIIPGVRGLMEAERVPEQGRQMTESLARVGITPVLVVGMVLNGLAEELVTKAYFIPRLREFFGSTAAAIVVAAALFASYHAYQGPSAVVSIFVSQCLLGWLFVRTGRLWPLALGHAVYDLILVAMLR